MTQEAKLDLDPQTAAQFKLLRANYSNTAHFVAELLQERFLQKQLRVIEHVLTPLHKEYVYDLKQHRLGQTTVLYWFGDRASGHWYRKTVVEMFNLLHDSDVVDLLALRPHPMSEQGQLDSSDTRVQEDCRIMKQYFDFVVELSSNRCWSQSFWTLVFPYNVAGLFATETADRHRCQMLCAKLCDALLKLEDMIAKDPRNADLVCLRDKLGTADWQLVREFLVEGHRCQFAWRDEALRNLVFATFAGPGSTKDALESAFNYLKDSVKSSKAKKMNGFTKFFYLLANPYAAHAGLEQIRPTIEDFQAMLDEGFKDEEVTQYGLFNYNRTKLGKLFPRPQHINNDAKVRKAGFHSNRNAAAAAAYMLHAAPDNFKFIGNSWAGIWF